MGWREEKVYTEEQRDTRKGREGEGDRDGKMKKEKERERQREREIRGESG